jgi:hypothetical protein
MFQLFSFTAIHKSQRPDNGTSHLIEEVVLCCGGNFFMLWGEPVLGAKKEREKKEKSSLV